MMKKLSRIFVVVTLCITLAQTSSSMMTVARHIATRPSTILRKHHTQHIEDVLKNAYSKDKWEKTKIDLATCIKKDVLLVNRPEYDGSHGFTPLCYALIHDDSPFIRYLLENGADPNSTLRETFAISPIFFAQSVEALMLLEQFGTRLDTTNKEYGVLSGMNLLHASVRHTTSNEHIFDHCLKKGLNPKSLTHIGDTLWHSLVRQSAYLLPEEVIILRAYKIKMLGINPDQKNNYDESATELVRYEVEATTAGINSGKVLPSFLQQRIAIRNKMQKLLTFMETHN